MKSLRSLRTRLFVWFLVAIVLAITSSALVVGCSHPDPVAGADVIARNISARLASVWEDHRATDAYVAEVREATGFELRLFRHPKDLPPQVHRVARRGGAIAPDGPERIFIPVLRDGRLVGALQMDKFGTRPQITAWWRIAAALVAALVVLGVVAGRVTNVLAHPLERLAHAVERFGAGGLADRADLGRSPGPQTGIREGAHGPPSFHP